MPDRSNRPIQLKCRQVRELLLPYLHNDVPASQREAVQRHLEGCKDCQVQLQKILSFENKLRADPGYQNPLMDRNASAHIYQELSQKMKRGIMMKRFNQVVFGLAIILLMIGLILSANSLFNRPASSVLPASKSFQPSSPTPSIVRRTATPVISALTHLPTPSLSPTIRVFPGSTIPVTIQDFTFQVSQAIVDNGVGYVPSNYALTFHYNDPHGLATTSHGLVPTDPNDNGVLIVLTNLQSGDKQKFLASQPKIIEEGIVKSPLASMTEEGGNGVFWIYGIRQSSKSFLFVFQNKVIVDLKLMVRPTPAFNNP
jgi:hypothetical protein